MPNNYVGHTGDHTPYTNFSRSIAHRRVSVGSKPCSA